MNVQYLSSQAKMLNQTDSFLLNYLGQLVQMTIGKIAEEQQDMTLRQHKL